MTFSVRDTLVTAGIIACASGVCLLMLNYAGGVDHYAAMVYLLAVTLVSRTTEGYFYGLAAAVVGVLGVNYAFTAPYFQFDLISPGYALTFSCMLVVSLITSASTSQIKRQNQQRMEARMEEMRANLLRAVSHDLRTPLTSILGATSILIDHEKGMPAERRLTLLREIADDAQWLIRMVENLLSITRINAGTARVFKREEAAEEIIAETVRKFRKRYDNFPVEIRLPEDLLMVPMDPILIEQVLSNLLENVAFHAKGATYARVTLGKAGNAARFQVADDGAGISREKLKTLFSPMPADSGTPTSDGVKNMGIGLSVCQAIIKAHGGEMTAENRRGGGALFTFTLPLGASSAGQIEEEGPS